MKGKRIYPRVIPIYAVAALLLVYSVAVSFVSKPLFFIGILLFLTAVTVAVFCHLRFSKLYHQYLLQVAERLDGKYQNALAQFPLPAAAISEQGEIAWYNTAFQAQVLSGDDLCGQTADKILGERKLGEVLRRKTAQVTYGTKQYTVYADAAEQQDGVVVLYYIDVTAYTALQAAYTAEEPVVLSVFIDNLEELSADIRDSERAQLAGKVQHLLENWIGKDAGILQKYDNDRFLIITDKAHLDVLVSERFRVLDAVRNMNEKSKDRITLSIGVGHDHSMAKAHTLAVRALEMALGRGGDQAAVKTENGFDFYGGISKSVERRTKVRTRMVASALRELVHNSARVLIMGHAFSDMDCIGSAAALAIHMRRQGKIAYVVVNEEQSLAKPLIEMIKAEHADLFLHPQDAHLMLQNDTLVMVTDTHQPERVEDVRLLRNAKTVAIIDHHRRTVNTIDNAVLFFHEPAASSACEMVAELLQYLDADGPSRVMADALLSGIVLDTRNFLLKAGVRTFEAAAYLRRRGADTVKVQSLFAQTMDMYRKKSALVADAVIYKDMAIAVGNGADGDTRIAASQAANELLTIRGVKASFALIETGEGVNISARSVGDVNVQLIMEDLGGGGHHTMAGAFLPKVNGIQATEQVKRAVDSYLEQIRG